MTDAVVIELLKTIRTLARSKRIDNAILYQMFESLLMRIISNEMVKVNLISFNQKKIHTIKVVRDWLKCSLKDSKHLVESAPVTFNFSVSPDRAREFVNDLRAVGASANVVL